MNASAVTDIIEVYRQSSDHFLEIYTLGSSEDPFKFKAALININLKLGVLEVYHRENDLTFIDMDKILAICVIAPFKAKEY